MRYYLIVGEASGDLHAAHLMQSLKEQDPEADFRFFGGDLMQQVGGTLVKHYRELAYMGLLPVLLHLPTILRNMRMCKKDIVNWQPDVVILVDYPGFNLDIAKFLKANTQIPVYYYISPKIWAWKEYRIKNIRRDVDELFSILPFEVPFFEEKHHYPIHYVGNPTAVEVAEFRNSYKEDFTAFCKRNTLEDKPIIALLAGSRRQEIKDNLPRMMRAAHRHTPQYQVVLAGAPGIDDDFYAPFLNNGEVHMVKGDTYALLSHAHVALVTSGTATLETALFRVPQVVCYDMFPPRLVTFLRPYILKIPFVSLVNLIADHEVVPELVAAEFTQESLNRHLDMLLDGPARRQQLEGYEEVARRLGDKKAHEEAAKIILEKAKRIKVNHSSRNSQ